MVHTRSGGRAVGGHSPAAEVVREALATIAAPAVATRTLQRALQLADETEIPLGGVDLRRFVERHLHAAASTILGAALADELCVQLSPMLGRLPSAPPQPQSRVIPGFDPAGRVDVSAALESRPLPAQLAPAPTQNGLESEPHPMATRRTERAPLEAVVLVASTDTAAVEAMRKRLRAHASVAPVGDVFALLEAAQQCGPETVTCILIDGAAASVHPATLATIADELPPQTTLASWRVPPQEHPESLLPLGPAAATPRAWLKLPAHLDASGAADELRRVLGLPESGVFGPRPR